MSGNAVHAGRRLRVLFGAAHKAGDLVFQDGFYGVVQDDIPNSATGSFWGTLILEGVWSLPRGPNTMAAGTKVAAPATIQATTLPYLAAGAYATVEPTANWHNFGRSIATAGPTGVAKIQLFNPNPVY